MEKCTLPHSCTWHFHVVRDSASRQRRVEWKPIASGCVYPRVCARVRLRHARALGTCRDEGMLGALVGCVRGPGVSRTRRCPLQPRSSNAFPCGRTAGGNARLALSMLRTLFLSLSFSRHPLTRDTVPSSCEHFVIPILVARHAEQCGLS